jgi:hypothetical protein
VLWVEMWRSAIFDERLAESVRRSSETWIEQIAGLIDEAQAAGSVGRDVNVDDATVRLSAVVDGLGLQILTGILSHDRAAELITGALEMELGLTQTTRSSA